MHIFTYPWKTYSVEASVGGRLGWKALLDAYNPVDLVKVFVTGWHWIFVGRHSSRDAHMKVEGHNEELYDTKYSGRAEAKSAVSTELA